MNRTFGPAGPAPRSRRPALVRRGAVAAALALALWLLFPRVASAHAHLVQADPAPGSVINRAPAVGSFYFDEPLNPTLTSVRVVDAAGRQVSAGNGYPGAGHNGELWQLALPPLKDGTYSVYWTSESATDGHVIRSFYTFQVAASGSADSTGAVTGAAEGVYGGSGSSGGAPITGGVAALTLITWLGLMAQALWLGALVAELAVLAPARARPRTPAARLAWAATPRLWRLVRAAPVLVVWALVAEIIALSVVGTGGDWGRAIAPATLGGILSSQNGRLLLLRCVVLLAALLVAGRVRAPAAASEPAPVRPVRRERRALGIAAPLLAGPAWADWASMRWALAALAAVYMLLTALSGHAADVSPGWLSYPVDWLHLVATAAWAGTIAALAFGVLPARRALVAEERAPAMLWLLDRFSPVALGAVGILALSGLYNALNHVPSPAALGNTTYGELLLVKIALVGVMIALSASHVWGLRPRIARLHRRIGRDPSAPAAVRAGLAALAARIRLEGAVGAAILLATALMGQTLPPQTTTPLSLVPTSIAGSAGVADLRADLAIGPPAVGATTFTLRLWEKGQPLSAANGAAVIHLYPADQPDVRATLDPVAHGTRFIARGSLAATGTWRADVLVRTATINAYRTIPFAFVVGPGATFLAAGVNPSAIGVTVSPGLLSAANTFVISGLRASAVRVLSQSLDMYMGILPYRAAPLGGGRWRVSNLYAPMNGRWGLTIQTLHDGAWSAVRQVVYFVPLQGPMRLLSGPTGSGGVVGTRPVSDLSKAYNVAFARTLPYTALVTQMQSNGVRFLGGPVIHTGLQAHGVDVLDGTPYAYVTNFGEEPGTVTQLDMRTRRVVRTFSVGLGPAHIVFTPDHRRAFVTDFTSSDLYMLDLTSGKTHQITFPQSEPCFEAHGIDISQDGHTVYVACAGMAWIYTVDTRTLKVGRLADTGGIGPYGVAVDAPRHEIWVTNWTTSNVSVLDERTLRRLALIPVGKNPSLLVVTPDGRKVYVADQTGNTVSVIDAAARRVIATIPVANEPHGPDVTADGKYVYVASIGGNAVTIIRTRDDKVMAVVPSPIGSNEVAIAH